MELKNKLTVQEMEKEKLNSELFERCETFATKYNIKNDVNKGVEYFLKMGLSGSQLIKKIRQEPKKPPIHWK